MKHTINQGNKDYAVRLGCERGLYMFLREYSKEMQISMSSVVRRLVLIGARCEAEHGNRMMPSAYYGLEVGSKELNELLMMKDAHSDLSDAEAEDRWDEPDFGGRR